jgi:hypothetical protein
MKTKASKEAYKDPENAKRRETHKQIVYRCLFQPMTFRELSEVCGLKSNQVQKRISDLKSEEMIIEHGEKIENGQKNTIWKRNPDPPLFEIQKLTLRQWLKREYPLILAEFNVENL